jgi:hypothetical protein
VIIGGSLLGELWREVKKFLGWKMMEVGVRKIERILACGA